MDKENDYVTAELSPNLIGEIKSFEERLCEKTQKNVFVIAYEKNGKHFDD
ncbi:hypothetical protein [Bacillus sp. 03113]|nr:hypothetical protein [Bacillus sp. 03113]